MGSVDHLTPNQAWVVIGTLAAVVALNVGVLGSDPWPFRPGAIQPHGALAPLVMHSTVALAVASMGLMSVGLVAWLWVKPQMPR